jgi:hypothetical protein
MRKVVDSNFLQCDALRRFLAKSQRNFAVLADYAAIEAYKADTLDILYRDMAILSDFPTQVIVLKGTQIICGLRGRTAGLQRRMIDQDQTRGFGQFCRRVNSARQGNPSFQRQLAEHGRVARHHMEQTDSPFTEEMRHRFNNGILMTAALLFKDHPRVFNIPTQMNFLMP